MAKQTEIAYEPTKEWADFQTGGTRIDADDLNNMEQGISDACAAVDELRTKRLPTYLVATGGDEATQDLYQEAILGPCLIVDLATATTYYDNGEDGEGHERTKLTSGSDIDALRDSLSRITFDSQGVLVIQRLNGSRGLALILQENGSEGFGFAFYPDRRRIEVFNVNSSGEWVDLSSVGTQ